MSWPATVLNFNSMSCPELEEQQEATTVALGCAAILTTTHEISLLQLRLGGEILGYHQVNEITICNEISAAPGLLVYDHFKYLYQLSVKMFP